MIQFNLLILFVCVGAIIAVPLKSSNGRVRRDGDSLNTTSEATGCIFDEKEYKAGQEVPSLGPCEMCVCEAPDVVCSMVKCQPNSGCRIIQQSGQCCPEYKCDCEYNGQVYNNGERLDNPDDPCKVCYCKGGEIMCTSVTCYERDDCQPHFSPGQCCPKYDHCPVESNKGSSNSVRSVNASVYSPKREMQPWPLTKSSNTQSSISPDESNGSQNNIFPQTIKIVEILPTTPGPINKFGEVSVIPRVKINDDENKEEFVKSEDTSKTTDESEMTQSTSTESFESSTIITLSTSEIEHLLDTTTQADEKSEKQLVEVIPERSVSTINPLSEQISITADPQPDSQKIATILPGEYSSVGALSNSENSTTWESITEVEGSGYELLRGGIYEDFSSELPEYATTEKPVDITHSSLNQTSNEETTGESREISSYEAYTTTEHDSSVEHSSSLSESLESYMTNDTSVEVLHSNKSSSELKSDLNFNPANDSEESSTESLSVEEKSVEDIENFNENKSGNAEIKTNGPTTDNTETSTEHQYTDKQQSIGLEASSDTTTDELVTEPNFSTENLLVISTESSLGTSAASLLSTYDLGYSTTDESSTLASESSTLAEPTKQIYNIKNSSNGFLGENKKLARLTNGKFDQISNDSQVSSSLTFPSILKVQSLGADQFSTQTESSAMENTTTMARIGIYHPTKTNESAGYLTIIDEKLNTSTGNEKLFSTHILLTPHDLKKLAELLIQEKIKPASIQKNSKETIQNQQDNNSTNIEGISAENISQNTTNTNSALPTYDSTLEVMGIVSTPEEFNKQEENYTSTEFPHNTNQKEYFSEDPNTSRQIRIPENVSPEFSTLLDDRDLRILENFFRKNIGFH